MTWKALDVWLAISSNHLAKAELDGFFRERNKNYQSGIYIDVRTILGRHQFYATHQDGFMVLQNWALARLAVEGKTYVPTGAYAPYGHSYVPPATPVVAMPPLPVAAKTTGVPQVAANPTPGSALPNSSPASSQGSINVQIVPHSVYVLCGPTMSGKTTFAKSLCANADVWGLSHVTLSSDDERDSMTDASAFVNTAVVGSHRHSPGRMTVSQGAFEVLMAKLKAHLAFPVSTEVIVVDTTGFDIRFRTQIVEMAKQARYKTVLVTFEYKARADYLGKEFEALGPDEARVVSDSVDRFRRKILPDLKAVMFDQRLRVDSKHKTKLVRMNYKGHPQEGEIDSYSTYFHTYKTREGKEEFARPFVVISDVHECVEEAKQLVAEIEAAYPKAQIVWLGDYLDKGNNTLEIIDFIYDRTVEGTDVIIQANHENYVIKRLEKKIDPAPDEVEKENFQSVFRLQGHDESFQKVKDIWDVSIPFLVIHGTKTCLPVFITHAPCSMKDLGKVLPQSLLNQRNYRPKDRLKDVKEDLEWLYKESDGRMPLHIFGHVTHFSADFKGMVFKNRVFLDTGCVYGGSLSAVVIENGRIVRHMSVKSTGNRTSKDVALIPQRLGFPVVTKGFNEHDYELTSVDYRLLRKMEAQDVRYISGTMAPGPSTNDEIEPMAAALEWLAKQGVTKVAVQPKYMGSRCQLYLYAGKPEQTKMVSRSGWVISKLVDTTPEEFEAFKLAQYERFTKLTELMGDMILDGELTPWRAMASSMIDHEFKAYSKVARDEVTALMEDEGLKELPGLFEKLELQERLENLDKFDKTLERYARKEPLAYNPFDLLWAEKPDKEYEGAENAWKLDSLTTEVLIPTINPTNTNHIEGLTKHFAEITAENGWEGVVLKPVERVEAQQGEEVKYLIPAMKVRSPDYLRLVYGYDYTLRLPALCRQKNISGKIQVGIKEDQLAKKMLHASTPEERHEYAVRMIGTMRQEKTLDPRL